MKVPDYEKLAHEDFQLWLAEMESQSLAWFNEFTKFEGFDGATGDLAYRLSVSVGATRAQYDEQQRDQ